MLVHRTPSSGARRLGWAAVLVLAAALPGPAAAEDSFHPLDSALEFMNLKAQPGAMPDFVQESRPAPGTKDYIPVGVKRADRGLKIKSPAEVKAMTAELDAARAAQLAGKRPKPPKPPGGLAAKPAPLNLAPRKTATSR